MRRTTYGKDYSTVHRRFASQELRSHSNDGYIGVRHYSMIGQAVAPCCKIDTQPEPTINCTLRALLRYDREQEIKRFIRSISAGYTICSEVSQSVREQTNCRLPY